ncbi:MAG: glycosyltransferase family 2 protein [Propionibacteriaceae bacterium]
MFDDADITVPPSAEPTLDLWSWAHEDADDSEPKPVLDRVLAILVACNGEAWLPEALAGLTSQTRSPDRIIAVDNGSDDKTYDILSAAVTAGVIDEVIKGKAGSGFGAAVESVLKQGKDTDSAQWLWLLQDDAVAAPTCLEQLLVHVGQDRTLDIIGPKLLQPSRRSAGRQISELGVSIADSGKRELMLSPGEIDQGQHEPAQVLGVSTCGMLLSTEVYRKLQGFDEAVPLFRDGVEMCWRARLAGYKVSTSPKAEMTHRQVGRAGLRKGLAADPTASDRAYGMLLVAAHKTGIQGPLVAIKLMIAAVLRAGGFLLGKAPDRVLDEMRALRIFIGSTQQAHALRARIAAIESTKESRIETQKLRPGRFAGIVKSWGHLRTRLGNVWVNLFGDATDASIDDLTSNEDDGVYQHRHRRSWVMPTVIIFGGVILSTLFAGRNALALGHLTSLNLLPVQDNLGTLVHDWVAPIPGDNSMIAPPWLGLLSLLSLFTFGQPEAFVTIIVLGAVPLAMLSGYNFLRQIVEDHRAKIIGMLAYGLLPVLLGAVNRGDLSVIITAIVLPFMGAIVLRSHRKELTGFESLRQGFLMALCLVILASFTPLWWGVALLLSVMFLVRNRGKYWLPIAIALLTPVLLLSPWLPTLIKYPGRLITSYDPALVDISQVSTLDLLIGRTPGAGLPPFWLSIVFFGGMILLGGTVLVLRAHIARGWALLALLGFALAVIVTRFVVEVPAIAELVRPAASTWLMLMFAALIFMVVDGWDYIAGALGDKTFGFLHLASIGALVVGSIATIAGIGWWVFAGEGLLHRTTFAEIPAFARQTQASSQGLRTLTIDAAGDAPSWSFTENDGSRLGDTERGEAYGTAATLEMRLRNVVADLTSGRPDQELTQELVSLGVGHVVLTHANEDVIATVGSLPGISQVTADSDGRVWRIIDMRSRVMIVTQEGTVAVPANGTAITAGSENRKLVVAAPQDSRWNVTLDGKKLEPIEVEDDERAWFMLGAGSGELKWELKSSSYWVWLQGLGLVALVILAMPSIQRADRRNPEIFARRSAGMNDEVVV